MPQEEIVYGSVPVAGELVPGGTVPPVGVESAVGKQGEFGEDVELRTYQLLSLAFLQEKG